MGKSDTENILNTNYHKTIKLSATWSGVWKGVNQTYSPKKFRWCRWGPSWGSRVRRPGSEDPSWCQWNFVCKTTSHYLHSLCENKLCTIMKLLVLTWCFYNVRTNEAARYPISTPWLRNIKLVPYSKVLWTKTYQNWSFFGLYRDLSEKALKNIFHYWKQISSAFVY